MKKRVKKSEKKPDATEVAHRICQKREKYEYWDLAQQFGCSVEEARRIVEVDLEMTKRDAMNVQTLDRGSAMLAEELGTTPDELDAFVESCF